MAIRTIHNDAFNGLFNVKILNISDNRFTYLDTYTVTHLVQLKVLDLSRNSIHSFGGELFLVKHTVMIITDN